MLHKEKVGLIADYLGFRFPMCEITKDDRPDGPGYRINRGGKTDHLIISHELLDDCEKENLLPTLEQLNLYDLFSKAKGRKVLLGNRGVTFE